MFVAQILVAFAVWVGYGVLLGRRRSAMFSWAKNLTPKERTVQAIGRLMISVAIVGIGLILLSFGGLAPAGLTWWGWPFLVVVGLGFVHFQTTGLVPLTLNAVRSVTPPPSNASDSVDPDSRS